MIGRYRHLHTFTLGAAAGAYIARDGAHAFYMGLALGALGVLAAGVFALGVRLAWRTWRRVERALPDAERGHPCAGPECNAVVYGRRRYCSLTCRDVAREARMRQRVHAERLADYGEAAPF